MLCALLYAIALGGTFTGSNTQPQPLLTVARTNNSSLEKCSEVKLEMLIKKSYAMDIKKYLHIIHLIDKVLQL